MSLRLGRTYYINYLSTQLVSSADNLCKCFDHDQSVRRQNISNW